MIHSPSCQAGGRNSVFEDAQKSLPVVSNKPTIIFGAHVTHPSVVDHSAPSIASVRFSFVWKKRILLLIILQFDLIKLTDSS